MSGRLDLGFKIRVLTNLDHKTSGLRAEMCPDSARKNSGRQASMYVWTSGPGVYEICYQTCLDDDSEESAHRRLDSVFRRTPGVILCAFNSSVSNI